MRSDTGRPLTYLSMHVSICVFVKFKFLITRQRYNQGLRGKDTFCAHKKLTV